MLRLMRVTAITLCVLVVVSIWVRGFFPSGPAVDERAVLARMLPSEGFGPKSGTPPHYESAGYLAFNTFDVVPSVRGYAGPIKTLVILDREGRIAGLEIIGHTETPNFVHSMLTPEYLSEFIGKSISDQFEPDKDIDAISRATVSVEALAKGVRLSSRAIGSGVLGMKVEEAGDGGPGFASYGAVVLVSLFAWALWACSKGGAFWSFWRDKVLAVSILVIGVWLSAPFSALHVYNVMLGRVAWDFRLVALWCGVVVGAVIFGRHYCGWLCPFGAISEFIGRAGTRKWNMSAGLDARLRGMKYYLLIISAAALLLTGNSGYGNFEPYVTLFSLHGTAFGWALLVIALAANLRVPRFWCRYFCPVAALTGLVSRRLKGYPGVPDCPMGNPPNMPVDEGPGACGPEGSHASECIRCNKCLSRQGHASGQNGVFDV